LERRLERTWNRNGAKTDPGRPPGSLEIRLLGEIRILRDSVVVPLPASKRTRALLGFLAATAVAQPREKLCDLLWDGPG